MKVAGGTTTYEVAMKLLISMTIGAVMALNSAAWAATAGSEPTAVGLWEQVDEKSGKAESWFNIVEKDGLYIGNIVKMFQKPGDPPPESFRCSKCEGADKHQPGLGL